MTLQEFFDKYNGKGIDSSTSVFGFKSSSSGIKLLVPWLKSVLGVFLGMFYSIGYFEIFNSIVKVIVVFVVNNFFRTKFPSQVFFKNLSVVFSFPIGVVVNRFFHVLYLALLSTKYFSSSLMTSKVSKWFFALVTDKQPNPRPVVTSSVAKSSSLRWGGVKSNFAYFTSIFHAQTIAFTVFRYQV